MTGSTARGVGRPASMLAVGGLLLIGWFTVVWPRATDPSRYAWDATINWTAARAALDGASIYDTTAATRLLSTLPDAEARRMQGGLFDRYIGPPSTVLFYLPVAHMAHAQAVYAWRVWSALLLVAAVAIAGIALPPTQRPAAWAVGGVALVTWHPVLSSLVLGQVDGWVVLALACGAVALERRRPALAGAALGVAALLKVSPSLVLALAVVRGGRRVLLGAVAGGAALVGASLLVAPTSDWGRFLGEIAPQLATGAAHVQNMSLAGEMLRLLRLGHDRSVSLGVALVVAIAGSSLTMWWARRTREHALSLALMTLVALMAGPITWDHYGTWALPGVMVGLDARLWERVPGPRRRWLAGAGAVAVLVPVLQISERASFPANVLSRLGPLALLSQFAVGLILLAHAAADEQRRSSTDMAGSAR